MLDSDVLQGDGVEIILNGKAFRIADKTPRQTRVLMAQLMRFLPKFASANNALVTAGAKDGKLSDAQAASLDPEVQAQLVELFEPLSDWLIACTDGDPEVADAVEYATEAELVRAFLLVKDMLQDPFVRRLKSAKPPPKRTGKTRR